MPIIIYAVVLMLFVGIYSWVRIEDENEHKPFATMVFATAFMLTNDFVSRMYIFDGFPTWLVVLTTYVNFGVLPVLGILWYRFVRSILSAEERSYARRVDVLIYLIAGIGLGTLALNPFLGVVFSFDASGIYHRGPLFFFPAGSTFLCIVISELFLSLRVRSLGRNTFVSMLLFPVPPLVGGIVAMFVYGIPWMPLGISISMVILFATLHTTSLEKDFLTGLLNRKRLGEVLEEQAARARRGRLFSAIMVDLDDFMEINDGLGHTMGDIALASMADIMQSCVRDEDTVARLGGDEFVIVLDNAGEAEAERVMERIEESTQKFNEQNHGFRLEPSMGYCLYDPDRFDSIPAFLERIDALMYANKAARKQKKSA